MLHATPLFPQSASRQPASHSMHTLRVMRAARVAGLTMLLGLLGTAAQAAAWTGTMKTIDDSNKVRVGYRESSIPFSYLDATGKPTGYATELCKAMVEEIKTTLKKPTLQEEWVAITSQTRIPLLINGTIDFECGSTTNSKERQKQAAFSYSYFFTEVRMLVKKDSGVQSLTELDGKPVVTTTGTTSDLLIKQNEQGKHISVKNLYGKDHADSFLMVDSGRAAAFVMDDVLLAGLIANSKNPAQFAIVGPALSVEPYGIMMRKDDAQIKKLINDKLATMMKNGQVEKLYDQWFLKPVPPKNVTVNLPMSPRLKEALKQPTDEGI